MTIAFVLLTLLDQARGQRRDLSLRIKQRAQKSDEKEKTVRTEVQSSLFSFRYNKQNPGI